MSLTNQTAINWQQLTQALRDRRCVLVLGSDVCRNFDDMQAPPFCNQLASRLSDEIKEHNPKRNLLDTTNLPYIAREFEDTPFGDKRFPDGKVRQGLGRAIQSFYETKAAANLKFQFYEELVNMPFHIIINASHHDFLEKALLSTGKDVQSHYYNYKKPLHNTDLGIDPDSPPIPRYPLLYNLFGNISYVESLVITEADRIRFAESIMQKEATASLPTDLRVLLKEENLVFLFMGFDFEEWHLRILLHVLDLDKSDAIFALQDTQQINKFTHFLYNRHFFVDFHNISALKFLQKLNQELTTPPPEDTTKEDDKQLFIMYAEQDETWRKDMEEHLAMLKNNKKIKIWHEGKMLPGDKRDETIAQHIKEADIILLLVTSSFLASDKLYKEQLTQALKRHESKQACIIPVLMSPCDWEFSSFADLNTLLPRNEKPLSKKDDRKEALKKVVEAINKIINHYEWASDHQANI